MTRPSDDADVAFRGRTTAPSLISSAYLSAWPHLDRPSRYAESKSRSCRTPAITDTDVISGRSGLPHSKCKARQWLQVTRTLRSEPTPAGSHPAAPASRPGHASIPGPLSPASMESQHPGPAGPAGPATRRTTQRQKPAFRALVRTGPARYRPKWGLWDDLGAYGTAEALGSPAKRPTRRHDCYGLIRTCPLLPVILVLRC